MSSEKVKGWKIFIYVRYPESLLLSSYFHYILSSIKPQNYHDNGNCLSSGKKPQLSREQLKVDQSKAAWASVESGSGNHPLRVLRTAPANTMEKKSVSLELAPCFLSFTYYPLMQDTGLTCSFHFVVTHNNWSNKPHRLRFPTTSWANDNSCSCHTIRSLHTKKNKWKKKYPQSVQNFFFSFWRAQPRMEVSGDFLRFFFPFFSALLPAAHSVWPCFLREAGSATCLHCGRQLWSAAGGPAGTAEPATCSGEFVWKRAARARAPLGKRTEPSTADRHTHAHTLTLAHCHPPPPFFTQTLSFSSSYPPPIHFFPPCRGLKSQLNLAVLQRPDSISGLTGMTSSLIAQMDCGRWIPGNVCKYGKKLHTYFLVSG